MAMIEIENLTKSFGPIQALQGVTFNVEEGEIFGFLGPNGSGKTTTISCMLGLLKPDIGKITINGVSAWGNNTAITNELGFIPSDPYFYTNWTGREHLDYLLQIKGKSKLLTKLIDDFDFNPKVSVKSLSTGNKQKLSIILAMMHAPRILIMDEPTRGLDPLLQNVFYNYVRTLQDLGSTIFMSSHNLPEVEMICSKVAIIKKGTLVEVGSIKSLQSKRVHIVTVTLKEDKSISKELLTRFNAQLVNHHGLTYEIKLLGDLSTFLKEVLALGITDINITNANLEEIFLEFYK